MGHFRTILASGAVLATVLGVAPGASAASPSAKEKVTVIARGLDNPRGLTLLPNGVVLVAEAGKGGDGPCAPSRPDPSTLACMGSSGAVTALRRPADRTVRHAGDARWTAERIITGLPSLAPAGGGDAIGLHDLALARNGTLYGVIGGAGTPEIRTTLGPDASLLGHAVILRHKKSRWIVKPFADFNAFEVAHNPDGNDPGSSVDSNPFAITTTTFGVAVADSGANDVLGVGRDRKISVISVLHARTISEAGQPSTTMQTVPTAIAQGPDGALYVGEFTGLPYPRGAARIWRVAPGRAPTVVADGFTNIADIAFDHFGRLLVLELSRDGLPDDTGALIRLDLAAGGTRTELVPGKLSSPIGLAVGPDNAIWVTNHTRVAGQGEVLRIQP